VERILQYFGQHRSRKLRIWTITYGETDYPTTAGTYAPGTLYVTQSTDENGYAVREYKDLEGQMIPKKRYR